MKVIVYATKKCQYYSALQDSCKKFNYELVTLGLGNKWNGMGDKILGIYNYLEKLSDKEEIVLVVDAYDVIICRDSKDIIEEFNKLDSDKVIFNAESLSYSIINNFGWELYYSKYKLSSTKYNKLNAGAMIGKTSKIIDFFSKIINVNKLNKTKLKSDQKAIYKMLDKKLISDKTIGIDSDCKIFTAVSDLTNDIVFKDNNLYNKNTKTHPFVIHGPGKTTSLDHLIEKLNIESDFKKSQFFYQFNYYLTNLLDFVILLSLFFLIFLIYKIKLYYTSKSSQETF
tara:strand:- start:5121 stop:5972 length:852 start_codon:yes stop_codon:yes gene_type:complete